MGKKVLFPKRPSSNPVGWWQVYALVGVLGVLVFASMGYLHVNATRMIRLYGPLVDAAMEIRLEVNEGYLWFEELNLGVGEKPFTAVLRHYDNAKWYATSMLEGGENDEGSFRALTDPDLRQKMKAIRGMIRDFRQATIERHQNTRGAPGYGPAHQRQHDLFREFNLAVDEVETSLQDSIREDLASYQFTQATQVTAVTLVASLVIGVLVVAERRKASQFHETEAARIRATESELRFRRLVENATDAFFLHDSSGRFLDVNEQACRSLGYSREELLQLHIADVSVNYDTDGVEEVLANLSPQATATIEDDHRRKDGSTFPVEVRVNEVVEDGRVLSLSLARDISDRMFVQNQLYAAKTAAEEASRAKSEFLANMSHEIRTPMSGVLGMLDVLLRRPWPAEATQQLRAAQRSARSLLHIINDILDFSRIEAGRLEVKAIEFDPRTVIERAGETVSGAAHEKGLELVSRVDPAVPLWARGDPDRVGQILVNLLGNAIKYTDTGEVVVQVMLDEPRPLEDDQVSLRFSVTDTGVGIPREKLGMLFESFRQVDGTLARSHGGTGLGLAICKGLVEGLGGSIAVTSIEGRGSTFSFTVPVGVVPASGQDVRLDEPAGDEPKVASTRQGRPARILLGEDDPVSRMYIRALLRERDWEVEEAPTGKAVVDAMVSHAFDLVLMDVQMPEMDGLEATRSIRTREDGEGKRIPIIGLSAHAREKDKEQCLAAGMDDFLSKPVDGEQLLALIESHLSGGESPDDGGSDPPADLGKAFKGLEDHPSILPRVARTFIEHLPGKKRQLRVAAEAQDCRELAAVAHSLRGSLVIFGAETARKLAETLEEMGEEARLEEAAAVLAAFERELDRLADFLSDYL